MWRVIVIQKSLDKTNHTFAQQTHSQQMIQSVSIWCSLACIGKTLKSLLLILGGNELHVTRDTTALNPERGGEGRRERERERGREGGEGEREGRERSSSK